MGLDVYASVLCVQVSVEVVSSASVALTAAEALLSSTSVSIQYNDSDTGSNGTTSVTESGTAVSFSLSGSRKTAVISGTT